MAPSFAASITRAASKQAYYTIKFLADRDRVEDAFRSYAYFRWVDDVLDGNCQSALDRRAFLEEQRSLLDDCYLGAVPHLKTAEEEMLVQLVRRDTRPDSGLQCYLRTMMIMMDFDVARRGRLISRAELNSYTGWLALAVTENMHYFVGHDERAPREEARYLSVTAAHIAHMLRDTFADLRAGYYNVPREVLEANHIGPQDTDSEPYRAWVQHRVLLARQHFQAGHQYLAGVHSPRYRLAVCAYAARFRWVLDTLENEGYRIRPHYAERRSAPAALRMCLLALASGFDLLGSRTRAQPGSWQPLRKP